MKVIDFFNKNKGKIVSAIMIAAAIATILGFFWPRPTSIEGDSINVESGDVIKDNKNQVINKPGGNIEKQWNIDNQQGIINFNEQKPQLIHPDSPTHNYKMGLQYLEQLNYPKALEWFEKALDEQLELHGPAHVDTARIYDILAFVYYETDQYDKAIEFYTHAISALGDDSRKSSEVYATFCYNIAAVYLKQADNDKGLVWLQKALAIYENVLGREHPRTVAMYLDIAIIYYNQGNYGQSLRWFLKAKEIREETLGKEHPDTKIVRNNIAYIHEHMSSLGGDSGRAE